jgi:serine/threonine-protein kinase
VTNSQFKIEQKLNESATTVVYRTFDEVLHRTVLLKVLHKHLANDRDLRERFAREARACAALRSEHIVQIYDLTEVDGAPAIVMEFVDGMSLKDTIASGQTGSQEFMSTVAVHVLRALSVAHERGIIHRDIKPGNILVAKDGTVKVTDFGLAYVAMSPTVTMEGMVLGTPAYMAPEQVRGDDIDQRTDLFALGVTLLETLSGERIFEGATYSECMKKVLSFKAQDLDRFNTLSTPEITAFLRKLLHPVKHERFATAGEALAAIGGGAQPHTASDNRVNGAAVRNRSMALYGLAAAVLLIVALIGWMRSSQKTEEQSLVPIQQTNTDTINAEPAAAVQTPERSQPSAKDVPELVPSSSQSSTADQSQGRAVRDSGRVLLTSSPWAKVYIDNRLIGETPIAKPVTLVSGEHTVMFANPSFDPIVMPVTVEPGREVTVAGNFTEHAGYLMCVVTPWAEVFVDEQYKDTTPLTKPLMLSAGKHTVRLKNASFGDVIREITVLPKDTATISYSFK